MGKRGGEEEVGKLGWYLISCAVVMDDIFLACFFGSYSVKGLKMHHLRGVLEINRFKTRFRNE